MKKNFVTLSLVLGALLPGLASADSDFQGWSASPGYHAEQPASVILDRIQKMLDSSSRTEVTYDATEGRVVYTTFASIECVAPKHGPTDQARCTYYSGEDWNGPVLALVNGSDGAKILKGLQALSSTVDNSDGNQIRLDNADGKLTCSIPASQAAVKNDSATRCRFGAASR